MPSNKQIIQALRNEVSRSLILSDEDKKFWLENAMTLPKKLLHKVTSLVAGKNKIVDSYIAEALANDTDHRYLSELKEKILNIKQGMFGLQESSDKGSAEDQLNKALENL